MTNETNRPGGGIDTDEAAVSRLYRAAATERTPAQLDASVLSAARRGARTRYWTATHWLRPMAWAATIGLCLGIVIELSTVPDEAIDRPYTPSMDSAAELDSAAEAQEPAAMKALKTTVQPDVQRPAADGERRRDEDRVPGGPAAPAEAASRAVPDSRQSQDAGIADRLQAAPKVDAESLSEISGFAATNERLGGAAASCSEDDIAAPERWLECIAKLETEGRDDEAARERERFEQLYPDYDLD